MQNRLGSIRDVIHDYIYYTTPGDAGEKSEKQIIDSEWVQRLRQVFQLQSARLIYPNAVHMRFQHSLGVMHLAGNMAYALYPLFREKFPKENIPERNYVEEVFRLAGLLHDIGHGPFGHLMDSVYTYPRYGITHEDISSNIIEKELAGLIRSLRYSPHGGFETALSPEQITKFIKMPVSFDGYELWEQVFAKIMMGIFSADAMDFLLRDQYFCGVREFGKINFRNLIDNTIITENGITLRKNALPAFRTFLQTRFNMFRHVYLYDKTELYDLAFGKLLPDVLRLLRIGNPYNNLAKFKKITDFGLHYTVTGWSILPGERGRIGRAWRKMLLQRSMPYVKVFEEENFYHNVGEASMMAPKEMIKAELINKYQSYQDVKVSISRNDIRLQNQFIGFADRDSFKKHDNIKALSIIDSGTGQFCESAGNSYIKDIPLKYEVIRVYIPEIYSDMIEDEEKGLLQGEFFSDSAAVSNENDIREDMTSM